MVQDQVAERDPKEFGCDAFSLQSMMNTAIRNTFMVFYQTMD
jgi:hypothetical protein